MLESYETYFGDEYLKTMRNLRAACGKDKGKRRILYTFEQEVATATGLDRTAEERDEALDLVEQLVDMHKPLQPLLVKLAEMMREDPANEIRYRAAVLLNKNNPAPTPTPARAKSTGFMPRVVGGTAGNPGMQ